LELCVEKQLCVHTGFVVGADGHDSIVRQRLGIEPQKAAPEHFAIYEFETDLNAGHEMKVALNRDTASVMWPLGERRCRWSFQIPADEEAEFPEKDRTACIVEEEPGPEDLLHQLQKLLRERAPWFEGGVKHLEWTAQIQFDHWAAEEFGRGRCWLVGDAAHQTSPVGMQSVNMGFSEAAGLAPLIARILRHGAPMGTLETYQWQQHTRWQKLLSLAGELKFDSKTTPWTKDHATRILSCLPASGQELPRLMRCLNVEMG
jgi:2-polyprenyl-6-methoxyphenol hydroxylase-like FAD-dependent oxidoreductase